jgi:hypothetical protein
MIWNKKFNIKGGTKGGLRNEFLNPPQSPFENNYCILNFDPYQRGMSPEQSLCFVREFLFRIILRLLFRRKVTSKLVPL